MTFIVCDRAYKVIKIVKKYKEKGRIKYKVKVKPVSNSNAGSNKNSNSSSEKKKRSKPRPPKAPNLVVVSKKLLKKYGLNAHAIKYEYLGNSARIALYDLFYDKYTKIIYICNKSGKIVERTYYMLK